MSFLEKMFGLTRSEKVKPVYTGTEVTYAESTWTSEQFFRDVLQNHFDAEANKFCASLEGTYISDFKQQRERAKTDKEFRGNYRKILFYLFLLSYRAGDMHESDKNILIKRIQKMAESLDVEMSASFKSKNFTENIRPDRPKLTYAVRNEETGKIIRGLDVKSLKENYGDLDKYTLFECDVSDAGNGYDSKKAVLYLPTKEDSEWCKGLFGEGLKVNQAKAMRTPGVQIRMSSVYQRPNKEVKVWARRAGVEGGEITQEGFDAILSSDKSLGKNKFTEGSRTTIRFQKRTDQSLELSKYMDPRKTDLSETSLEILEEKSVNYPKSLNGSGSKVMPGLSTNNDVFMKGLKIKKGWYGYRFGYDYWDNTVLDGRDRSRLDDDAIEKIKEDFWVFMNSEEIAQSLVDVVFGDEASSWEEHGLLETVFKKSKPKVQEMYRRCLKKTLDKKVVGGTKINVIATIDEVSKIKEGKDNYNFIIINSTGSSVEEVEKLIGVVHEMYEGTGYRFLKLEDLKDLSTENVFKGELSVEQKRYCETVEHVAKKIISDLKSTYPFSSIYRRILSELTALSRSGEVIKSVVLQAKSEEYGSKDLHVANTETWVELKNRQIFLKTMFPTNSDTEIKQMDELESRIRISLMGLLMLEIGFEDWAYGDKKEHVLSYLHYAQMQSQRGISSIADNYFYPNRHAFSNSDYLRLNTLMQEQSLGAMEQSNRDEERRRLQGLMDEVHAFNVTPDRLLEIAKAVENVQSNEEKRDGIKNFKESIFQRALVRRIFIGGYVYFLESKYANGKMSPVKLAKIKMSDLLQVGTFDGRPVRVLNDEQLIIEYETTIPSILKSTMIDEEDNQTIRPLIDFRYQDMFFELQNEYIHDRVDTRSSYIDHGCILLPYDKKDGYEPKVVLPYVNSYQYLTDNPVRDERDLGFKEDKVKSPVTLNYTNKNWLEPKRIFQDLHQNHRDASPDGVKERFLVERNGRREWLEESDLGKLAILGYELSDNGSGYSPIGIQNMGHTRKRNPLLTGQNGEGLKLASAACLLQGLEIEFSSTGLNKEGHPSSWVAKAFTEDEEYDEGEEEKFAKRLCFDIKEQGLKELGQQSSRTRVQLSETPSAESVANWEEWRQSIDPRKKNKFGDKGMNALVIKDLKKESGAVTIGPVTCLPNRPGYIYENRELMKTVPQDGLEFLLGWNFPRISDSRERKYFSEKLVRNYIELLIENCTDEILIEKIIMIWSELMFKEDEKKFKGKVVPEVVSEFFLSAVAKSKGKLIFKQVFKKLFPDKIIFSKEYAERHGIDLSGNFGHVREEDRIYLSSTIYGSLSGVLPSMGMWMETQQDVIINCGDSEKEPLRKVVLTQIMEVEKILERIQKQSPEYLADLLRRSKLSYEDVFLNLQKLKDGVKPGGPGDVFYGADDAIWHGLASVGIGINIELLKPGYNKRLGAVIDHEIVHKMTGLKDYENEFIEFLTIIAAARLG